MTPKRLFAISNAAVLAAALAGCTVGPDYHRPRPPAQSAYVAGEPVQRTAAATGATGDAQRFVRGARLRADWYRLYKNPALDELIAEALAANPTRHAAQARLAAAREVVAEVAGGRYPSLGLSVGASRNRASGVEFGIQDPAFVNTFDLYRTQLAASYDLDLFGELTRRIENRQALAAVARDRLRGVDATLVDNVVATALAEAAARTTLTEVTTIAEAQRNMLALARERERYGTALQSDVLRAQAQLADTEALLPDLRQQIAVARHRLAILTGQAPADYRGPRFTLDDFALPTEIPVSLPSQLVRQRPDVLEAEDLVHAAQAEIGVATARLLPQFRLTAGYGRIGLHPEDLVQPPAEIFDFGANLLAPLFEGGRLRAQKRQAVDLYRAAAADYRAAVLAAFDQVADSLRALQNDAQRLAARQRSRLAAEQSAALVATRYAQGAADAADLYLAQVQLRRAEIGYATARLQRLTDTASLLRALGGGWWDPAAPASSDQGSHP